MQKVTIKLPVTVQTQGPGWQPGEWLNGKMISPEVSDVVMIPPGEPYTCSVDEACKKLRRWGGEIVSENPPQSCADAIAAWDAEQAKRFSPYVPHWHAITVGGSAF